ncbi:HNH endonuclease [Streptomyces rishiriensis]|uniref:HNH endonuclease n=1 Tax=Streptomyces rishiriensis TaxID=68264 RepID=UPI00379FA6B8
MVNVDDVYGLWTVTGHVGGARHLVTCECGTEREVYASSLLHGKTISCGCLRRSGVPKVGDVIGEWTVLEWAGPPARSAKCRCSCGTVKLVEIYTLGKDSRSCGHARVKTALVPRGPGAARSDSVQVKGQKIKRCAACQAVKSLDEFHVDRGSRDGRRSRCRPCVKRYDDTRRALRNTRAREVYAADPAAKLAKTTHHRRENPDQGDLKRRLAKGGGKIVGDVTPESLAAMRLGYDNACFICKVSFEQTTLHGDHYKPIANGGDHGLANLRPLCGACNHRKQARWPISKAFLEEVRISVVQDRAAGLID